MDEVVECWLCNSFESSWQSTSSMTRSNSISVANSRPSLAGMAFAMSASGTSSIHLASSFCEMNILNLVSS
ncbi:hypothetical protein BDA96_04G286200 [Sorghum bicolor]|uniref:Uncharacterized protein n=1 Tax=Sorghum bicolor TaxID=4558 RepID=A0A921R924_SORBI|nr:hypothetical protein BDA96_04G286200 [Sorghum bicolor]